MISFHSTCLFCWVFFFFNAQTNSPSLSSNITSSLFKGKKKKKKCKIIALIANSPHLTCPSRAILIEISSLDLMIRFGGQHKIPVCFHFIKLIFFKTIPLSYLLIFSFLYLLCCLFFVQWRIDFKL